MSDAYAALLERIKDIGRLEAVENLLDWDQETYMPPQGVTARSEMMGLIAALKHERRGNPELGRLLQQTDDGGDPLRRANIRETRRIHERAVKVPTALVKEIAETASVARDVWARARADDDFPAFAPLLQKLIDLKKQEAEAVGFTDEPYDALIDLYEPGASTAQIAELFAALRRELAPLAHALAHAPRQPDFSILERCYPCEAQERLARDFAAEIGFDWDAGRLDVSVHPFCQSMGCRDVRITTRYDEHYMPAAVFGVMHEVGHALYEQGLDPAHAFTPAGTSVSLGIHESQSRFWENLVGRSRPFWQRHFPRAQELFPEALRGVTLDAFHAAINTVAPSLIRVEADEVTYNLHIIVRFELERDLFNGKLSVPDVPAAWNRKMTELVGITPPNDREGCLQDIHWSMGAFGYFATYTLGNLYAAQFHAAARRALPDLDDRIRRGDARSLLEWLRRNIHHHGMRYRAAELVEIVTGRPLSITPFIEYVNTKFRPIYGLD